MSTDLVDPLISHNTSDINSYSEIILPFRHSSLTLNSWVVPFNVTYLTHHSYSEYVCPHTTYLSHSTGSTFAFFCWWSCCSICFWSTMQKKCLDNQMREEPESIIWHYLQKTEWNSLFVARQNVTITPTHKEIILSSWIGSDVSPLLIGSTVFVRSLFHFFFCWQRLCCHFSQTREDWYEAGAEQQMNPLLKGDS